VIDPIDEEDLDTGDVGELAAEPQNIVEHDEPDLDWFACPMLPRGDMLAVIERHRELDGRSVNLFRKRLGAGATVGSIRALRRAEPLPSGLPLHLHDTRSEPISIQELASRIDGRSDRASVHRGLRAVLEYLVLDR
jgi:hypothetical protein